jgi:hypothetical protein
VKTKQVNLFYLTEKQELLNLGIELPWHETGEIVTGFGKNAELKVVYDCRRFRIEALPGSQIDVNEAAHENAQKRHRQLPLRSTQ